MGSIAGGITFLPSGATSAPARHYWSELVRMSDPCTQVDIDEATADAFVSYRCDVNLSCKTRVCHRGHLKAESQDFHEFECGHVRPQGSLTIVEDSNTANFAKGGTASAGEKELAFDTTHECKTDHVSRGTNTRSENTVTGCVRERSCFEAHEKKRRRTSPRRAWKSNATRWEHSAVERRHEHFCPCSTRLACSHSCDTTTKQVINFYGVTSCNTCCNRRFQVFHGNTCWLARLAALKVQSTLG